MARTRIQSAEVVDMFAAEVVAAVAVAAGIAVETVVESTALAGHQVGSFVAAEAVLESQCIAVAMAE